MAKRLTEKQREEILRKFREGYSIDLLAKEFNFTNLTISRNLKKYISNQEFKSLNTNNRNKKKNFFINQKKLSDSQEKNHSNQQVNQQKEWEKVDSNLNLDLDVKKDLDFSPFTEIVPLTEEIENLPRKDFSSVSIFEVNFPNVVYMVVDKKIELEIKKLEDYPEWHFLSENELQRKTIEIYTDLKAAKRSCNKEQKVIKVPNTKVFEIAAPILISRGISRIISDDKLIAL
ncbi:helix-turn-helix domain-containing protein [Prochlorococcus marinus]|uniref:helix-turn-helix domain-containing protein n=1 Tax=Prochlorococcus marinus TaxID=1219 RepID=UPI001ADC047F|nr:helix-turn-helix domain-containing protein [Prochlorococcus marinus]MBO8221385.1 helix-turn-helix domain-containing protein [Prochlorococcus marinus CUG1417]MBW3074195.1 hypothetical protein [Prochlorococcus marinus str. MU1417]